MKNHIAPFKGYYSGPPTKNFRLGHCFGPAYLLDLLHNPKCTGVFVLSELSYLLIRKGCAHHSFSLRATKQNYAFSEVVPKGRPQKIPAFRPHLLCPHVAYHLSLWSSSSRIRHYILYGLAM